MMDLEKKQLDEVMLFIKETDGNELCLEIGEMRLMLKKGGDISLFRIQPVDRDSVGKNQALEEEVISVTSPSVGIFYSRSEPDAHPYVEVGSFVEEGDTLALIEVMKTFGPVSTEVRGHIVDILAKDGEMVEHGQTLFLIKREGVANR